MLDENIPHSRKENFLKLVGVSKSWIKNYGFKSFLQVAFTEFKKHKMDLFKTDISKTDLYKLPTQELSEFDAYKIWLVKNFK